jgi:hypothetical protein
VDDKTCLFYSEQESVRHLFFECCVAKLFWSWVEEITRRCVEADFESVASLWLHDKKCRPLNVLCSAIMWTIWKSHNELCFQGK